MVWCLWFVISVKEQIRCGNAMLADMQDAIRFQSRQGRNVGRARQGRHVGRNGILVKEPNAIRFQSRQGRYVGRDGMCVD